MNQITLRQRIAVLAITLLQGCLVYAQVSGKAVSIALPASKATIKKPASDLVLNGKVIDATEAANLATRGSDISLLNPEPNKMWQDRMYSTSDAGTRDYPAADVGVRLLTHEAGVKFTSLFSVQSNAQGGQTFRLGLSRYAQPMMMRAALLRKLGYFVPSPKYYANITVTFATEDEKFEFIAQAELDTSSDFESRKWIKNHPTNKLALILSSATLETVSPDYFDLPWGLAPNPDDPAQVSTVQRFSNHRAYRALIVPYTAVDVPESVNRYSIKAISVASGFGIVPYFMADSFQAAAYEDARWITRRLAQLTDQDLQEIVAEGNYPSAIAELVLRKLKLRVRSFGEVLNIPMTIGNPSLNFTSKDQLVVNGKVTKEFSPGYPQRFSHGERTSPYQEGDFARYLSVEGKSAIIRNVINKLNDRMQFITVEDHAADYQKKVYNRIIDHIRNHPGQPLAQKVDQWGGPLAGLNLRASRFVGTGTYNGSTAPVQLIDQLSMSAGIGYFHALDGIQKYTPFASGNLSVTRDYTHVRPILSVKEGNKEPWKNLVIPNYMRGLAKIISLDKVELEGGATQDGLQKFLSDLRDGEVFTITDSLAVSASLSAVSSLDVLFGLTPFSFINSVTLGADANRVILRQIQFVKGSTGVHVYVRTMKNRGQGLELNVSYFIRLLKIRAESQGANIVSDGFLIDYDPTLAADADPESEQGKKFGETGRKLKLALIPLIRNNDPELLYNLFNDRKFNIEHDLKTKESQVQFLNWRFGDFNEDHLVRIQYPRSDEAPDLDPKDEEVVVFSNKRGEIKGRDFLSLGFSLIDGILSYFKKEETVSRGFGDNPANVPVGKAYWRVVNSETDLSKMDPFPNVSIVQHVWGGWKLSKNKFLKIIKDIKKEFDNTPVAKYALIDAREFQNMKSLDFYRITANLSILNGGLENIRKFIEQPSVSGARKKKDMALYNQMVKLIGEDQYLKDCIIDRRRRAGRTLGVDDVEPFRGNDYRCLTRDVRSLISLAGQIPKEQKALAQWNSKVISYLDDILTTPQLLKLIGEKNYIYLVRINGFRPGDEDGDLEYFSNTYGSPEDDYSAAGGIINLYVRKTGIMPTELDRTLGGYQ